MIPDALQATTRTPRLNPLSRRAMIGRLGGGLGATGVASALSADQSLSHYGGKARRVIQLFMNGGPYQGDLFDPKPLLHKYAGQRPEAVKLRTERQTAGLMPSPFRYRRHGESGLEISELLPHLSRHSDRLCVIRSLHTDNPNHGPALLLMNNGTILPPQVLMMMFLMNLQMLNLTEILVLA